MSSKCSLWYRKIASLVLLSRSSAVCWNLITGCTFQAVRTYRCSDYMFSNLTRFLKNHQSNYQTHHSSKQDNKPNYSSRTIMDLGFLFWFIKGLPSPIGWQTSWTMNCLFYSAIFRCSLQSKRNKVVYGFRIAPYLCFCIVL